MYYDICAAQLVKLLKLHDRARRLPECALSEFERPLYEQVRWAQAGDSYRPDAAREEKEEAVKRAPL